MSIQIKLKNSVVQDSTPSTSDLPAVGEIALNANINSIGGFMRASDNTIVKIFGPGSLTTPTATTTVSGIAELATSAETTTGSATNRVVTPAGLNAVTVAERTTSNNTYLAKAGGTLTGVMVATAGSASAPAINFGDNDSGIFGGSNTVSLSAGGATRLTADTGVSVTGTLAVTGAITSTSDLTIAEKIIHSGDTDTFFSFPAANIAAVDTAGSERLRVDASGRLLIGTTAPRSPGAVTAQIQLEGTNAATSSLSITRNSGNTGGPNLIFNKTRGTAVGADTSVNSGDTLGIIAFAANDGTDSDNLAASIVAKVDGTPGTNDTPGRIEFTTTLDGSNSTTPRMVIKSSGLIGMGTESPNADLHISGGATVVQVESTNSGSSARLVIKSANDTYAGVHFGDDADEDVGRIRYYHNTDHMQFSAGASERMRINSSGQLLVGLTSSSNGKFVVEHTANQIAVETGTSGDGRLHIGHFNNGTFIGTYGDDGGAADLIRFGTHSGDERMRIQSNGKVGIGISSPDQTLHVHKGSAGTVSSDGNAVITAENNNHCIFQMLSPNTVSNRIMFGDPEDTNVGEIQYSHNSDSLIFTSGNVHRFNIGSSEKVRISSSGDVGIGTNSPNTKLDVRDSSATGISSRSTSTQATDSNKGLRVRNNSDTDTFSVSYKGQGYFAGNVGVGTTSPAGKLHISSGTSGDCNVIIEADTDNNDENDNPRIVFRQDGGGDQSSVGAGNNTLQLRNAVSTSGGILFMAGTGSGHDSATEAMRVDSSRRLLIGTTAARSPGGVTGVLEIEGTNVSGSAMSLTRNSNDGGGCNLTFNKTRSTSTGGDGLVSSGDTIGAIRWCAADGQNADNTAAFIMASVDGATGTDDIPGRLVFGTAPDGSNSASERMRIDNQGRVKIGTTTEGAGDADNLTVAQSGHCGITIRSSTSTRASLFFADGTSGEMEYRGFVVYDHSNNVLKFGSNANERIRIHSGGNTSFGSTSDKARVYIKGSGNGSGATAFDIENSDSEDLFRVRNDGGFFTGEDTGSPYNHTTSSTANARIDSNGRLRRQTSSRRYKKDITDATWGLAEVLKLKPVTFKSNRTGEDADDKTYAGFIAEDVHDIGLTEFVEYNTSNQPDALGYAQMVALLTNAIKELAAKVTKLEAA